MSILPRQEKVLDRCRLEWLNKMPPCEGETHEVKVVHKELTLRGLVEIQKKIKATIGKTYGKIKIRDKTPVRLILLYENPEFPDGRPEQLLDTMKTKAMLTHIEERIVPDVAVSRHIMSEVEQMGQVSNLKAAIVTLCCDDKVGGFTYLTTVSPLDKDHIKLIVDTAENHLEEFKRNIKKDNPKIQFESDNPIILLGHR